MDVFLIIGTGGSVNVMNWTQCHRCGRRLVDGELKYQVEVKVRSMFDGVVPEADEEDAEEGMDRLLSEISDLAEEELNGQVYEDDVFVVCPACKEAFLETIYSNIHPQVTPEHGRAHLLH